MSNGQARIRVWIAAAVGATLLHTLWLLPLLLRGGFQNQDVAGIVYNARVLLSGGLPYLDTVEMKSPGAFFATAPALGLGGLRGFWVFAVLWATATSLATGALVSTCWGHRHAQAAVLMHAAGTHAATVGDANYGFWMALPFTLAQVLLLRVRAEHPAPRAWALIGATAFAAVAFKHNAVALLLPIGLAAWRAARGWPLRSILRAALNAALGATAVATCLLLPYLFSGRLLELLEVAYAHLRYSSTYVEATGARFGGKAALLGDGLRCIVAYAPGVFVVMASGLVRAPGRGSVQRSTWASVAVVTVSSLVALALTLRFFHHDVVMVWPSAVLLGLTPGGPIDSVLSAVEGSRIRAMAATLTGLLVTAANVRESVALRLYLMDRDDAVATLCRDHAGLLEKDDTVFAWGWTAWSTYEHCQRFAPGPHYKELGIVTTINTNICSKPFGTPMFLRQGPDLAALSRELWRSPPRLIVVSPYYSEMGSSDPLNEFSAAQDLLRRSYVVGAELRGFTLWLRASASRSAGNPGR